MPTYSYKCDSCQDEFDRVLKISDRDNPCTEPCPKCNEYNIKKMIGASATVYTLSPTSVSNQGRVPDSFKEVLQRVHDRTPGSILNQTSRYVK